MVASLSRDEPSKLIPPCFDQAYVELFAPLVSLLDRERKILTPYRRANVPRHLLDARLARECPDLLIEGTRYKLDYLLSILFGDNDGNIRCPPQERLRYGMPCTVRIYDVDSRTDVAVDQGA